MIFEYQIYRVFLFEIAEGEMKLTIYAIVYGYGEVFFENIIFVKIRHHKCLYQLHPCYNNLANFSFHLFKQAHLFNSIE
jgi:hypothetical protein